MNDRRETEYISKLGDKPKSHHAPSCLQKLFWYVGGWYGWYRRYALSDGKCNNDSRGKEKPNKY